MNNNVNHPQHYIAEGRKECIVEMEELFGTQAVITFCECNAFKYNYRKGLKEGNSLEQDEQKAQWYQNYAEELRKKL